jgi:hypothetical protein
MMFIFQNLIPDNVSSRAIPDVEVQSEEFVTMPVESALVMEPKRVPCELEGAQRPPRRLGRVCARALASAARADSAE